MGLIGAFRRAEEQARKMAQASMQRTIVGLDDAERAIRRRMRVYPKRLPPLPLRTSAPTVARGPLDTQSAGQVKDVPKAS